MLKRTHYTQTPSAKAVVRELVMMDAKGEKIGRLATRAAAHLIGKHKVNFATNIDVGDYVVILNAGSMDIDQKKQQTKLYNRYSGYQGGQKQTLLAEVLKSNPTEPIMQAIKGMLPDNKLKTERLKRLFVFAKNDFQLPKEIQKLVKNNG